MVQETKLGPDVNGTHHILACANNVNWIGDYIRTIERNADLLLNDCNDIDLAVNSTKTEYMEAGLHKSRWKVSISQ